LSLAESAVNWMERAAQYDRAEGKNNSRYSEQNPTAIRNSLLSRSSPNAIIELQTVPQTASSTKTEHSRIMHFSAFSVLVGWALIH